MKKDGIKKSSKFKEFLKESISVYAIVFIVLTVIGIFYSISVDGNVFVNIILIILAEIIVIGFVMLLEYLIWKKKR